MPRCWRPSSPSSARRGRVPCPACLSLRGASPRLAPPGPGFARRSARGGRLRRGIAMWHQDGDRAEPPAASVAAAPGPAEDAVAGAARFPTLRDYLAWLEARGELVHVTAPVR